MNEFIHKNGVTLGLLSDILLPPPLVDFCETHLKLLNLKTMGNAYLSKLTAGK